MAAEAAVIVAAEVATDSRCCWKGKYATAEK